jgi:hypothetical protein
MDGELVEFFQLSAGRDCRAISSERLSGDT